MNASPDPPPAGLARRAAALLGDSLLVGLATLVLSLPPLVVAAVALYPAETSGSDPQADALAVRHEQLLALLALGLLWSISTGVSAGYWGWSGRRGVVRNGQTLGMQLLRVRVVRQDGQPLDGRRAARRWVLLCVLPCQLTLGLYALVELLVALRDPRRRTLHDRWSGTTVVRAECRSRRKQMSQ